MTEQTLERKLRSMFPDPSSRAEAKAALETYGTEPIEQEPVRMRLAILKLADGDLDEVRRYAGYAKEDFRDVLAWAENPRMGQWANLRGADRDRLIAEERREYEDWLKS